MYGSDAGQPMPSLYTRGYRTFVILKLGEFSRSYLLHMFSTQFLDASANIDAQMKKREQGTVIVETVFCYLRHLNLVSFIVHSRFTCVTF